MLRSTLNRMALPAVVALLPMPGVAGDYAQRSVLGFSPNGQYFAFEEYGIEDGSGFPYSNIFLIDTTADEWVDQTPIRVRTEGDSPSLSETRAESADRFRPFLVEYQIGSEGTTVAANPLSETSANPHYISFLPRLAVAGDGRGYELAMEEYELAAPGCPDFGQPYKGFQLTMVDAEDRQRMLSRDEKIPGSRHCPLSYAISEVVTYYPPSREPVFAVLVSVLSVGFEGPDRRFLAVTGKL